ncbi:hypothetical protein [Acinetobacter sp. ANC 3813]|uniref:hypothetical protein n=1 Tax=Acinetobacter sp. ANC 3813 TaxID=1977873 RepID=UPI000B6496BC|nr:hypothetical protein [Acinetobacter sp. ANC 3813]OTG87865.1 hypothetical protein B9T34_16140 [Acinetobacter sp. ANC 3813]
MSYPIIEIANQRRSFTDATVGSLLTIAKLNKSHYESQLTAFLSSILGPNIDFMKMTAEERYCHLLVYLDLTQDRNALRGKTNPADYISKALNDFSKERVKSEKMDMTVRHLTGLEVTALEIGCETTEDWMLGEMGLTIGLDERLPPLDTPSTLDFTANVIHNRIETIKGFSAFEFNEIYDEFLDLQGQQQHLVNIAFDNGIVLEKIDKRGTDDAPCRFRPDHAFTGYAQELLSIALGGAAAVQY